VASDYRAPRDVVNHIDNILENRIEPELFRTYRIHSAVNRVHHSIRTDFPADTINDFITAAESHLIA
jgi:hypothetical protein